MQPPLLVAPGDQIQLLEKDRFTFQWEPVEEADWYEIWVDGEPIAETKAVSYLTENPFQLGWHSWRVVAVNNIQEITSERWRFLISPLNAPQLKHPLNKATLIKGYATRWPTLTWNGDPANMPLYKVYINGEEVYSGYQNSFQPDGFISLGSFEWYVVAKKNNAEKKSAVRQFSVEGKKEINIGVKGGLLLANGDPTSAKALWCGNGGAYFDMRIHGIEEVHTCWGVDLLFEYRDFHFHERNLLQGYDIDYNLRYDWLFYEQYLIQVPVYLKFQKNWRILSLYSYFGAQLGIALQSQFVRNGITYNTIEYRYDSYEPDRAFDYEKILSSRPVEFGLHTGIGILITTRQKYLLESTMQFLFEISVYRNITGAYVKKEPEYNYRTDKEEERERRIGTTSFTIRVGHRILEF